MLYGIRMVTMLMTIVMLMVTMLMTVSAAVPASVQVFPRDVAGGRRHSGCHAPWLR